MKYWWPTVKSIRHERSWVYRADWIENTYSVQAVLIFLFKVLQSSGVAKLYWFLQRLRRVFHSAARQEIHWLRFSSYTVITIKAVAIPLPETSRVEAAAAAAAAGCEGKRWSQSCGWKASSGGSKYLMCAHKYMMSAGIPTERTDRWTHWKPADRRRDRGKKHWPNTKTCSGYSTCPHTFTGDTCIRPSL